ncbi:MAG TPA: 1-deoxy-D-xylulose-5-phosphate synthase [Candidatus Latescibacteria bacterium]|nr:1-deoxy-D-xylulose-5-phosphate synthase [Candidatus Latescibacterota bacterium]
MTDQGRKDETRIQDAEPEKRGTEILDTIDSPEDLRRLKIPELVKLAQEIRQRIIAVVSRTGGHLAPSLGAVELAIALHYVFKTPGDKIIWDVGHQAYAHKLLTGRRDAFETLRQYGGISGFLRRDESPYDTFGAGHASTSISAALGIAYSRDLAGEHNHVVAVIGDGAMGCGLALEGLNNAGASGRDIIVVLNDNRMCISPNVGALAKYFTDIITTRTYIKLKTDIWELTGMIPSVGGRVRAAIRRLDESIKSLIVPGVIFEKMGFRYLGPVDGHNLSRLIRIFKYVKDLHGPILIHVYTIKGKGYFFAEKDASKFHSPGAFDKVTGNPKSRASAPAYSKVFAETLTELAQKRKEVIAITAAMAYGTGLDRFAEKFPDRFFDVGIAESHAVTFAAGLASAGYRPVVAIYSTFLQRAFDQIIHDVALQNLPVIFAVDRSGLVGEDGPTHHGAFDLSYLRQIPNMVVMAPKDELELKGMLKLALDYKEGPIALRYPRGAGTGVDLTQKIKEIKIGKGEILREGRDAMILAVGSLVWPSFQAAQMLKEASVGVANMRFVKPLDGRLLRRFYREGLKIITVEENTIRGGFGSAVMEFYEEHGMSDIKLKRLGIPDQFIQHGPREVLLEEIGLTARGIAAAVRKFLKKKADSQSKSNLNEAEQK